MGKKRAKRKQYDSVFRMLFKDKEKLLSLYNAIAGTDYKNENDIEIQTLENAIYIAVKNDLAFLLYTELSLYEHQSTVNPNMPLRFLQYVSEIFEKHYITVKIYSKTKIELPSPTFITFYTGIDPQPERKEMLLSDLFAPQNGNNTSETTANLELRVLQLNLNAGYNEKLKEECPSLMGYVTYITKFRAYKKDMPDTEAAGKAIDECIKEKILVDFFRKNRAAVMKNSLYYFDQDEYDEMIREEGREEGEDRMLIRLICKKLRKGKTAAQIADELEEDEVRVNLICEVAEPYAPSYDESRILESFREKVK